VTIKSVAEPRAGLNFSIPKSLNKGISVVEVGPFNENSKAKEINKFLGTNIEQLNIINTYILIHKKDINNLESLLDGKPFVDPITHQATLNESLALKLGIPFDYVLQSMLNPGTSDEDGNILLEQSLISLGKKPLKNDLGLYSKQYFLKGNLNDYEIKNKKGAACCVVMASGGYPGEYKTGKEISGLDSLEGLTDVYVFHAGTKIENGKTLTNGGRVLGVTGTGNKIEQAIDAAYSAVSKISFENKYYRTDIGAKALKR